MTETEELTLPTESFDATTMITIFHTGLMKDHLDAYNYIFSYFYETDKRQYYKYDPENGGSFKLYSKQEFNDVVLEKLECEKKFTNLVKKSTTIFNVSCEIFKPRLYKQGNKYFLNLCVGVLHKKYKPFDEYDDETKAGVKTMLDFIYEVPCNNNKAVYDAYLKYYSQLFQGIQTQAIIYRKTFEEGVGKSTETSFIIDYVLGNDVCIKSCPMEPLTGNFNGILIGKLLCVFEEMPVSSTKEWMTVSSKIKTMATENEMIYRKLNENPIQLKNIGNFQINTNVDALKDKGRRIIELDINTQYKGNKAYFMDLHKKCFNLTVGEAFFSYVITKTDITNFSCQVDFPVTNNKLNSISNSLHPLYKFIKYRYINQKREINCKITDFKTEFIAYCNDTKGNFNESSYMEFLKKILGVKKLTDIGNFTTKTNGGYWYIKYPLADLKAFADNEKWYCGDDLEEDTQANPSSMIADLMTENIRLKADKSNDCIIIADLQQEINDLKKKTKKPHVFDAILG